MGQIPFHPSEFSQSKTRMASLGQLDSARSYVTAQSNYTNDMKQSQSKMMAQPQPPQLPAFFRVLGCIECYQPSREYLEYDYTYDDTSGKKPPQAYPRIRERGEYYIDSFNGEPWSCSFGTAENVSSHLRICSSEASSPYAVDISF